MKSKINLFTDKSYDDNRKLSLKVSYTSGTLLHDSSISISLLPEQRADSNHYFSALRDIRVTCSQEILALWSCPHFSQIDSPQWGHFPFAERVSFNMISREHRGFGHHLRRGSKFILKLLRNLWYFWYNSSGITCLIVFSRSSWEQWGQLILST